MCERGLVNGSMDGARPVINGIHALHCSQLSRKIDCIPELGFTYRCKARGHLIRLEVFPNSPGWL